MIAISTEAYAATPTMTAKVGRFAFFVFPIAVGYLVLMDATSHLCRWPLSYHQPVSGLNSWIGILELCGAVALILGAGTRAVATVLACATLVAFFAGYQHFGMLPIFGVDVTAGLSLGSFLLLAWTGGSAGRDRRPTPEQR